MKFHHSYPLPGKMLLATPGKSQYWPPRNDPYDAQGCAVLRHSIPVEHPSRSCYGAAFNTRSTYPARRRSCNSLCSC